MDTSRNDLLGEIEDDAQDSAKVEPPLAPRVEAQAPDPDPSDEGPVQQ